LKTIFSTHEIDAIAKWIFEKNPQKVILFKAEMGVGKTTLIKALCKVLQVKDNVSSPTFSLINQYKTKDGSLVYHFDFYRIKSEKEAFDFDVEDYLYSGCFCFLEWFEKIPNLIPKQHTLIEIKTLENQKREITFF